MKRQITFLTIAAAASLIMTSVQAEEIELFDYACNIDGAVAGLGNALPGNMDISGFDDGDGTFPGDSQVPSATGMGQIDITVSGAGAHTVICFVDHEIDQAANSFFNEAGETGGALGAGMSWQIGDPTFGDILDNVLDSTDATMSLLDNTNGVPITAVDDVSMAIGFDFTLTAAETAVVSFFLDIVNGAPGFFLNQFDPDSMIAFDLGAGDPNFLNNPNELFFWATNTIAGGGPPGPAPVPEPGTIGLLGLGLMGIAGMRRRQRKQS